MAKAAHYGRVTFSLNQSRFYIELGQSRVQQPFAHIGYGFSPPTKPESATKQVAWGSTRVMRLIQFRAIMLAALALVPSEHISRHCRIRWQWRKQPPGRSTLDGLSLG